MSYKYGAILEARMGSTRLPGKSMMDLAGKPLMARVVNRIRGSRRIEIIVLATTTNPRDDVLEELSKTLGIHCFRGSEDNVLERVVKAAELFNIEHIIELHGDNPFLDPEIIDLAITEYEKSGCDYISNTLQKTYPGGLRVQVFPYSKLNETFLSTDDPAIQEHVSLHFYENPEKYVIMNLEAPPEIRRPDIRLTIDTPEDLELARAIYLELIHKGMEQSFNTKDVIEIIDSNRLTRINMNINSKPVR